MAKIKFEEYYASANEVITKLFSIRLNRCEDAGCGMYNYSTRVLGIDSIIQCYIEGEYKELCYVLMYSNDGEHEHDIKLSDLPIPMQWGIAMQVAGEFGVEIDCEYKPKD